MNETREELECMLRAAYAAQDAEQEALRRLRKAADGACDECGIVEAVEVLISQRDNARHYADTFRAKLKELGHEFV